MTTRTRRVLENASVASAGSKPSRRVDGSATTNASVALSASAKTNATPKGRTKLVREDHDGVGTDASEREIESDLRNADGNCS